jgi:magnesium chelatase family protein
MGILRSEVLFDYISLGELSLDGSIRHVNGVLPAAMHAAVNKKGIICPAVNGQEAAWASSDTEIIAAQNILSLINHLKGTQIISRPKITQNNFLNTMTKDISDVEGQSTAKKALMISAAGGHNILFIGFPGTGKSMLASRINTILPELDPKEMLEVSMIHSVAGLIKNGILSSIRPFRSPHHSASMPSIIGGGRDAKPGEITIAHRGILFLDELAEYPRNILDSLRQPIESGEALVSRVNSRIIYPSKFQLVAAMNPCPCGFYGDPKRQCSKAPRCAIQYQQRVSGPIMDRIDIHVNMENNVYNHLATWAKLIKEQNENPKKSNSVEFDFLPGKIFHGVQILNASDDFNKNELNFKLIYDCWENKLD